MYITEENPYQPTYVFPASVESLPDEADASSPNTYTPTYQFPDETADSPDVPDAAGSSTPVVVRQKPQIYKPTPPQLDTTAQINLCIDFMINTRNNL